MFTDPLKNVWEFGYTPGQYVADFGSGSGHVTMALSKAVGDHGKVFAIDLNESSLVRLKNLDEKDGKENIEVIYGDLELEKGSSLRRESLDGVVMSNLLFQLEDIRAVIKEAKRVVKSGGKISVVDWEEKLDKQAVIKAFEKEGLNLAREFPTGDHHYGLIFNK